MTRDLEVAATNRENIDSLRSKIRELSPQRRQIQVRVRRRIVNDDEQIPIALGRSSTTRSTSKEPNFIDPKRFNDPLNKLSRNHGSWRSMVTSNAIHNEDIAYFGHIRKLRGDGTSFEKERQVLEVRSTLLLQVDRKAKYWEAVCDEATLDPVKSVASELLEKLKAEKLRVDQWREKEATRDAVQSAIRDYLWSEDTGLPVTYYTEDDVAARAEEVFRHVYRAYPTLPSPYYGP